MRAESQQQDQPQQLVANRRALLGAAGASLVASSVTIAPSPAEASRLISSDWEQASMMKGLGEGNLLEADTAERQRGQHHRAEGGTLVAV